MESKKCSKCSKDKDIELFYHGNICKQCAAICQKEYRKSDKYKEYRKEYRNSAKGKEYRNSAKYKEYRNSDKHKEYNKEYQKSDKYKESACYSAMHLKRMGIPSAAITPELIELKRVMLKLRRVIYKT